MGERGVGGRRGAPKTRGSWPLGVRQWDEIRAKPEQYWISRRARQVSCGGVVGLHLGWMYEDDACPRCTAPVRILHAQISGILVTFFCDAKPATWQCAALWGADTQPTGVRPIAVFHSNPASSFLVQPPPHISHGGVGGPAALPPPLSLLIIARRVGSCIYHIRYSHRLCTTDGYMNHDLSSASDVPEGAL